MEKITYKQLVIVLSKQGGDYTWKVTKSDGSTLDETAESAEEFQSEEDAVDDAKEFIDSWYKAE